jgi:cold-inducible RNA-binding protein
MRIPVRLDSPPSLKLRALKTVLRSLTKSQEFIVKKKLYVGNLPFDTQEDLLRNMFGADGRKVQSVQIISDRMTGRSKGFGFVEFESEQDAETALQAFNGKEFNGRALVVNEAREQQKRPFSQDRFGGRGDRGNRFGW